MKIILFIIIAAGAFTDAWAEEKCFDKTFYAVNPADGFYICSRGKECEKNDNGLKFSSLCKVEIARGDVIETVDYTIDGDRISFTRGGDSNYTYILSDDGTTITSAESPEKIYKTTH